MLSFDHEKEKIISELQQFKKYHADKVDASIRRIDEAQTTFELMQALSELAKISLEDMKKSMEQILQNPCNNCTIMKNQGKTGKCGFCSKYIGGPQS